MLKETPNQSPEKIKSALSQRRVVAWLRQRWKGIVFVTVASLMLLSPYLFYASDSGIRLRTASKTYTLEVADKSESQAKGLGGRVSLGDEQGMVFVFDELEEQCFWMKDMAFSIDMIWLDIDKKVQKVEQNVSPETYPDVRYCHDEPTKYVIELLAGEAKKSEIKVGEILNF